MTDIIVTMKHLRAIKFCAYGGRAFFARYGLDWSAFLRGGIAASELEATGDALALKLVEFARAEGAN